MNTLDPTLDIVFKLRFGGPESQPILVALLTAVLQPQGPITEVTVLNPGIPKQNVGDKGIELDLLAHLDDGTQANVEIQAKGRTASAAAPCTTGLGPTPTSCTRATPTPSSSPW